MERPSWVRRLLAGLDDAGALLLPRRCLVCGASPLGREQGGLCRRCAGMLPPPMSRPCPRCGSSLPPGHDGRGRCPRCGDRPTHVRAVRASHRYEGVIRDWIHVYKFRPEPGLVRFLGPLISGAVLRLPLEPAPDLIVPVPLHPVRRRIRGFNQSERLARFVAGALRIPLERGVLVRVRNTAPQVGQGIEERRRNLRGAFRCRRPRALHGRAVAVVDDVLTTGATLGEAARVLKRAGVSQVHAVVLARVHARSEVEEPWLRPESGF